jgi:hypothetical protein
MTGKRFGAMLVAAAVAIAVPLFGEVGNKKLIEVSNTQQVPFQPGGTIHVNHSYGELSVQGWDQPTVELTVTKTPDELYAAKDQATAAKRVEAVKVSAERKSDTELEINTTPPHYSRWTHPFGPMAGVWMQYRLRVPRNSKLVIHHENGEVMISGVTADIEATGNAGDIVVLLPETQKYSIDAKSKFGAVTCDFDGDFRHGLAKSEFALTSPLPAHNIQLRIGRGGIEIKGSPAEAQPHVAAGMQ